MVHTDELVEDYGQDFADVGGRTVTLDGQEFAVGGLSLLIEDDGNMEALVIVGSEAELVAFLEAASQAVLPLRSRVLELDRLAALVVERGVDCIVEQTGGHIATLFAGGIVGGIDGERYVVAVGPGRFAGPNHTEPLGWPGELVIGPDDGGEAETTPVTPGMTHEHAADLIVAMVRRLAP
jgi:hypothetical protein